MITVGVDLSAQADGTGLAVLGWSESGAVRVTALRVGVGDHALIEAMATADKVGVDCPFGWPEAFVDLVLAHRARNLAAPASSGREWRRGLALRETDRVVHARTGLTPLSVSADRIGHAAMRWAAIAARLAATGVDTRRDGSELLAEVYPAAALKVWGLTHRGYKRAANVAARGALVEALCVAAPWLDLGDFELLVRQSDDALDAVLCALVARAVAIGATSPPAGPGAIAAAGTEGWIHVPTGSLADLVGGRGA
ncbi:MAG: DUF429 domain-containing protein [Candidatus Nanopelagicales bacterium]